MNVRVVVVNEASFLRNGTMNARNMIANDAHL